MPKNRNNACGYSITGIDLTLVFEIQTFKNQYFNAFFVFLKAKLSKINKMILRDLEHKLVNALENRPVVALVGPRQSGKTTLALQIAQKIESKKSSYLDLELDSDLTNRLKFPA